MQGCPFSLYSTKWDNLNATASTVCKNAKLYFIYIYIYKHKYHCNYLSYIKTWHVSKDVTLLLTSVCSINPHGTPLGFYSLSGRVTYRSISWRLEAARFGFRLFQSLWHLASTSAATLPRCLSYVCLVNRGPESSLSSRRWPWPGWRDLHFIFRVTKIFFIIQPVLYIILT